MNFFKRIINAIIFQKAKLLNAYENIKYRKYLVKIEDPKLIFDIGYNLGNYSKEILKLFPQAKIIGIEANVNLINSSFSNKNITKINYLVSNSKDKYHNFYINREFLGMSTASEKFISDSRFALGSKKLDITENFYEKVQVPVISIEKLINTYGVPNLTKIDVEGYEFEVIKSINKYSNKITFEWHEEFYEDLENIIIHLMKIGYTKFGVIGYFTEKTNNKILKSNKGDPFSIEPPYYKWEELELKNYINKDRRIHYGMVWAK